MRRFLIYTNLHKDPQLETTKDICTYLRSRGAEAFVQIDECVWQGREVPEGVYLLPREETVCADCILVLGGDGTVLSAAREIGQFHIPMIGVNLGTLGYLTEIEVSNLEYALDKLIAGEYTGEDRMMLDGSIRFASGEEKGGYALNDIVISRSGVFQIIQLNIYVNGEFLNTYHADGVIVTTPTGSTGYSLSAGGPLIEPKAKLIMLTPICPHSLNHRSIVLSAEDVIEIEIPLGREGRIQTVEAHFDGSQSVPMNTGDRIRITQSKRTTEFLRINQVSFLEVLHKKMAES